MPDNGYIPYKSVSICLDQVDDRRDHNKWIVINLQEFNLIFLLDELKMLLGFVELMTYLPSMDKDMIYEDSFMDEHIFLILSTDPWYVNIIFYLQTIMKIK